MTRPKLRAGQLGAVQTIELPSGRFQARALLADELGKTQRVKASGETEDEATAALRAKAEAIRTATGGPTISPDSIIAQACIVFLHDKTHSGTVEDSTLDVYEATIRNVIVPTCGELMLRDFTVRRCNRILAGILESRSLSAARKARSVLSQVCLTGIEYDVLVSNPVRDARRLPLPEKKTSVLTPEQLIVVQRLIHAWRLEDRRGPRPNVTALENGMWIMVGTSQRIGEVLALRRRDSRPARSCRHRGGGIPVRHEDRQADDRQQLREAAAHLRGRQRAGVARSGDRHGRVLDAHLPPHRRDHRGSRRGYHHRLPAARPRQRAGQAIRYEHLYCPDCAFGGTMGS